MILLAQTGYRTIQHPDSCNTMLTCLNAPARMLLPAVHHCSDLLCGEQEQESSSQKRRSLQQYTARCHVWDISKALLASMHQPNPGSIYNVVDDNPASRAEAISFARQLLSRQSDSTKQPDANVSIQAQTADSTKSTPRTSAQVPLKSSPSAGYGNAPGRPNPQGEKRVSNSNIKSELNFCLDFPSYQDGLTAIHAGLTQHS